MTTTTTEEGRLYVASLSHYNAGHLTGEWITVRPEDTGRDVMAKVQGVLERAAEEGPDVTGPVEEYAIHDFQGFPRSLYSEYMGTESFEAVASYVRAKEQHGTAFEAFTELFGYDTPAEDWGRQFQNQYIGSSESVHDFAINHAERFPGFDFGDLPPNLSSHIDWEGWIRANATGILFERVDGRYYFFRQNVR